MASQRNNNVETEQQDISCEILREPSSTMSARKADNRPTRHHKRKFSFQESGSSPISRASVETATTAAAANHHRTIERAPSQFNAAFFDRQSIRSSRSCSNLSQRDVIVQDCSNAVALYNPYFQQQLQHSQQYQLALPNVGGEYVSALPPPPFPPPPPPSLFWYQQYASMPPPFYFASQQMPPDFETFKCAMKLEKKKMEAEWKQSPSACAQFCCSSVAQILWAIIALACFGLLTALIFALFLA